LRCRALQAPARAAKFLGVDGMRGVPPVVVWWRLAASRPALCAPMRSPGERR
jgi:hypothetical protein